GANLLRLTVCAKTSGYRFGPGLPQRVGLRLATALGHRLGEVGEDDGQPQPERNLKLEAKTWPSLNGVSHQRDRREHAADLDDEHHGVARHRARIELAQRAADGATNDRGIPD